MTPFFLFFLSFTSLLNQKHSFPLAVFRFASECVHVVVKRTPLSCIRSEKSELDQEQLQTAETSEAQAAGGSRRDRDPASRFTGILSSQATGREPTRVFPEQKAGQKRRCLRGEVQLHRLSDQDGAGVGACAASERRLH